MPVLVVQLQLVGALAADDAPRAVGIGAPVALTVPILETAVSLGLARRPVPAVDAHAGRSVADVEATTALAVARAYITETHPVRQQLPWKPDHTRTLTYDMVGTDFDDWIVTMTRKPS